MDLKQPLPDTVRLFQEDQEWIQVIDYEHVPFRCRKCHALGHLLRDCPLNNKPETQNNQEAQSQDGFTKVTNRRRGSKKFNASPKTAPEDKPQPSTSNSFGVLSNTETPEEPRSEKTTTPSTKSGEQKRNQRGENIQLVSETWNNPAMDIDNPAQSKNKGKEAEGSIQETHFMEDDSEPIDIGELDILGLEQACKSGNFDKIPDTQVDNLVEILNKAQKKYSLAVQTGSQWEGKFASKDSKKRGRKTALERAIKIGEVLVESGRYAKLTKYYNTNPKTSQ